MVGGVMAGGGVAAEASEGKRTAALRSMLSALKRRGSGRRSESPSPERGACAGAVADPLAEWRRRAAARAALLERGYAPAAVAEAAGDPWAEHSSFGDCAASFALAAQHAAAPESRRASRSADLVARDVAEALALARAASPRAARRSGGGPSKVTATGAASPPPLRAPAASWPRARADAEAPLPPPEIPVPPVAGRDAERTASSDSEASTAEALHQRVSRVLAASAAVLDSRGAETERIAAALALAAAPQALTDDEGGPLRRAHLSPAPLRVAPSPPRPPLVMGEVEDALTAWRRRRQEEAAALGAAAPPAARAAVAAAEAAEAAWRAEEAAAAVLGPPPPPTPPPPQRLASPPAPAQPAPVAAAPRAPLARRALILDDGGASAWPAQSAPSGAAMTLLHAPAAPAMSPRSAAAVFPPRPQSRSPSPPRRPPSPPARRPSPPPLSLGPSAVGLGGPPALRSLALPLPRGRDDSTPRSPSRSPLGRDAPRAPLPWGHPADVTACWPNHGPVTASCDSPPPGGAHLPCGGDDLVAALLQGTVEALLFGGSIADSDSARSSASAAGRVPDAFWPPEMTAEASPPAVVMHARADSPAMPPAVAEHAPPQHLRSSEPEQLASVVTWRVAEDTPSPDGSASGSDAGAEAEAEEAADPVVAALLARIAACRAELRALESPSR